MDVTSCSVLSVNNSTHVSKSTVVKFPKSLTMLLTKRQTGRKMWRRNQHSLFSTLWKQNIEEEEYSHRKFIVTDIHCPPGLFLSFTEVSSSWPSLLPSPHVIILSDFTNIETVRQGLPHFLSIKPTNQSASVSIVEIPPMLLSIDNVSKCA